jgi:GTP pyrophosphokinase
MEKKTYKSNDLRLKQIEDPNLLYDELRTYIKDKKIFNSIKNAYEFAEKQHQEQKRKSGDPYIYHPLTTAYFLAQLKMSPTTIIAGLLHDIIEDTPISKEQIAEQFGEEVAFLVDSVTKVTYFAKENREEIKADYLRKLYLSMAQDIRVVIIKICDRLHNMLTINYLNSEKQIIIANETLHIYSTIAHRLGMNNVKSALEDMSFKVLQPKEYQKILDLIEKDKKERTYEINKIIGDLDFYLKKEHGINNIAIFGRNKTIYSIYRKITMLGKSFDEINDIYAIRIICNSIAQCYEILGLIHQKYIPISDRFKDYIAIPKNNLYQSLHTTLSNDKAMIFEVQIRTEAMDEIAETGAAAH